MRLFKPLIIVCALTVAGVAFCRYQTRASSWRERLKGSATLTLYSLIPNRNEKAKERLDGYGILGQTKVSGREKDAVVSAVRDSEWIYHNMGGASCGFSPRVAIETEDGRTRVLLCFSCGDGLSIVSGARERFLIYPRSYSHGKRDEDQLNATLRRHHVPLPKPGPE